MAIKRTTKVEPSFSMSSMTDIVFLLLIFFLVTSTLINPNALMHDNTYTYHINGDLDPINFSKVEDALVEELQTEEDPTFVIYADETVPIKEVVQVMNIAKRNHYKVIMATSPE